MSLRARTFGAALCAVATAAMLAGCGAEPVAQEPAAGSSSPASSTPSTPSTSAGSTAGNPASTPPAAEVPEQLRFTATTLDGEPFSGSSLAGKAAVLWFWAPWCPNCRAEAPSLARTAGASKGEVTFVGVASQAGRAEMREFVRDYGVGGFRHLDDSGGALWQRFGVTYQPAYAFVSPDGTVEVVKQQLSADELADRVGGLAG
ncbi:thiol-disulfide isomerase/thioredoxin [Prauserella shujinwangii]|uniref:Thiol-disulfide isomerase/thioredoxin n=1 Tax=Prauserella shujinwangii TaxID=1453103 RepID=A0A2T0M052_9PSEU|nr:redoxin domain-containing protein [Prauserella shujinwangii]PRX49962.1 thiol-disulfide isomerase/thioredoxin [Prauserella shujinwangii]